MKKYWWEDDKNLYVSEMNKRNKTNVPADNINIEYRQDGIYAVGDEEKYTGEMKLDTFGQVIDNYFGGEPVLDSDGHYQGKKVGAYIPALRARYGLEYPDTMFGNLDSPTEEPVTLKTPSAFYPISILGNGSWINQGVTYNSTSLKDFDLAALAERCNEYKVPSEGSASGGGRVRVNDTLNYSCGYSQPGSTYTYDISMGFNTSANRMFLLRLDNWGNYKVNMFNSIGLSPVTYDFTSKSCYFLFFYRRGQSYYYQLPPDLTEPGLWDKCRRALELALYDTDQVFKVFVGHNAFMAENTGTFVDPTVDRFVINEGGVLVNNRHYTYKTRQQGQPDGDATTEGQSILIIGYIEQYRSWKSIGNEAKATECLDLAKHYFKAYVDFFYGGVPVPETPQRWASNWIINGKSPVLAHYPLAPEGEFPTHGGYKDKGIWFDNGVGKVAHGGTAGHWGEYLDVVGKVYEGKMGWNAINANPYLLDEDGKIDYSKKGKEYEVAEVYTWSMEIISGDGEKIGTFEDPSLIGTVKLKDPVSVTVNISFAVRLPVEHGGYMIKTNECQHNRPLHVPVTKMFQGNASDAEQWFCEVAYDLWKITGDEYYGKCYRASLFTIMEYVDIDAKDKFFRQVLGNASPDTDGISYNYTYPSGTPTAIDRTDDGYIRIRCDEPDGVKVTMEQNAIWFRVNKESKLRVTYSGNDDSGEAQAATVILAISPDKAEDNRKEYKVDLPPKKDGMEVIDIPIGSLVDPYKEVDGVAIGVSNIDWSEDTKFETVIGNITHVDRTAGYLHAASDGTSMQFTVGMGSNHLIRSLTYRSSFDGNLRVEDADGWRWWVMLPASPWQTLEFAADSWKFSGYQPNANDRPEPGAPVWGNGPDDFTILFDEGDAAPTDYIDIYAVNDLPALIDIDDGYTMLFNITFTMKGPGTSYMGDCTIIDARDDALPYTPGVIPFSNNNIPDAPTFDSWRGQPYPGYQYPFFFALQTDEENPRREVMIKNVIDFWFDSQQWYSEKFGVLGPGASAYVWDRWDKPSNEEGNTWTMWHFGDSAAWSGYQARAFYGAVKMYETMKSENMDIPDKLLAYITNWMTYLEKFVRESGTVPTEYPMDKAPVPVEDDFTGHMSGLYLAGVCKAFLHGITIPGIHGLIGGIYKEIYDNFVQRPGVPDRMNGSWSPWSDPDGHGVNGMFFGFWSGELQRGLSLYQAYQLKMSN